MPMGWTVSSTSIFLNHFRLLFHTSFDNSANSPVPTSCCLMNYSRVLNGSEAYNCTYEMAANLSNYKDVSGCKFKIDMYIDNNRVAITAIPCALVAFQVRPTHLSAQNPSRHDFKRLPLILP